MKYTATLTLRRPSLLARLWYWRIGIPAPLSESRHHWSADWVRLLPANWSRTHRRYAERHGYFWAPCVLCDRPYGGHQSAGSIPDPTYPEHSGRSVVICPRCTRAGRAWQVPHPLEAVLGEIYDKHDHGHDPMLPDCVRCLAHDAAIRDAFADWQPPSA
jgi:hypothetical protein